MQLLEMGVTRLRLAPLFVSTIKDSAETRMSERGDWGDLWWSLRSHEESPDFRVCPHSTTGCMRAETLAASLALTVANYRSHAGPFLSTYFCFLVGEEQD